MKGKEALEFINKLSKELNEQVTDGQANPRFWSVAQYEYRPCWVHQADKHIFADCEGDTYDTFDEVLEMLIDNGYIDTKYGYEDIDDLKGVYDEISEIPVKREHIIMQNTMFLTKREVQEHIKSNHYHYNKTVHTYAMTAWRSPQVENLIKLLTDNTIKAELDKLDRIKEVIKEVNYIGLYKNACIKIKQIIEEETK